MKRILLTMLAVMASPAMASPSNSTPEWKSYQQTGNPADIVSSPQVAAVLGAKIDATDGQAQNLQIQGGTQTVTPAAGDNSNNIANTGYTDRAVANLLSVVQAGFLANTGGTVSGATTFQQPVTFTGGGTQAVTPAASDSSNNIANTSFVGRAVTNAFSTIKANPALIGFQAVFSQNITVCASGCQFSDFTAAYNAAVLQAHLMYGNNFVEIDVGNGTYNINHNFSTSDPATARVHIVGNTSDPTQVVLNFTGTKGTNFTAFLANDGGIYGYMNGFTVTQPADGSGAMASTDSAGRHLWNANSYGAGFGAYGGGSTIVLGPQMIVRNFYYSLVADNNGFVDVPNGSGVYLYDAGDVNAMARGGGTIVCLGCHASGASDYTNPSVAILGSSFDAERGGTLYIDGSTSAKTLEAGLLALSGGAAWAHNMAISSPVGTGPGALISGNSAVELGGSSITGFSIGVNAQYGFADISGTTLSNNSQAGVVADGGVVTGSNATIQNNTQYGVQALHQGRVTLFASYKNMSGNGTNFSAAPAGTTSGSGSSYTASSIDVQ
ncbi:autotransporter outer membrane beta-barrel domain-containing protein [Asaia krungthepensis]|uniref:Uncharacterized protein n=1 Tax=Asaia krungthepensis NRIC 0535 TaxID=1307925 RepID=A0ABQ0Q307_9PROT|nr:hypothetical protein [Asaia krungthepensis]GBQ88879.1 hypothetical protein AA0535_1650 [Asaia krungthepensis NRIC 0535]